MGFSSEFSNGGFVEKYGLTATTSKKWVVRVYPSEMLNDYSALKDHNQKEEIDIMCFLFWRE